MNDTVRLGHVYTILYTIIHFDGVFEKKRSVKLGGIPLQEIPRLNNT